MKKIPRNGKSTRLNAIVVLGDQDAGKSTLIRHLSGVYRDDVIKLATSEGKEIQVRAIISSVNERDEPPKPEEWAEELIESATGTEGYGTVLLPLRYVSKGENPPAEQYFKALEKRANVQVIAFRETQPSWVKQRVFHVDRDGERNERAREVRRHLAWV